MASHHSNAIRLTGAINDDYVTVSDGPEPARALIERVQIQLYCTKSKAFPYYEQIGGMVAYRLIDVAQGVPAPSFSANPLAVAWDEANVLDWQLVNPGSVHQWFGSDGSNAETYDASPNLGGVYDVGHYVPDGYNCYLQVAYWDGSGPGEAGSGQSMSIYGGMRMWARHNIAPRGE